MRAFNHAYNGIPTVNSNKYVQFEGDAFGYAPLDYIAPDRLSGFIDVEIKTMTPTLPGFKTRDGAIAVPSASGNPHGAISIRDAFIPATALKGMLSSAYEAVTMSRLRIFDKQHKRLYSHRPPARTAQSSYPTFLTYTEGKWEVVFGFEKKELNTIFQAGEDCPQYVGLIDSTAGENGYADVETLRNNFPHLSDIQYNDKTIETKNGASRKIATAIRARNRQNLSETFDKERQHNFFSHRGFVVRTRPDDNQTVNSKRKRYEFIFPFVRSGQEKDVYRMNVSEPLIENLISVLHDYAQNALDETQRLGYSTHPTKQSKKNKAIQSALSNTPRLIHEYLKPKLSKGLPPSAIDVSDETIENYLKDKIKEIQDNGAPGIPVFASITLNQENKSLELTSIKISPVGRTIGKDSVSAYQLARDKNIDPPYSLDTTTPGDTLWGFVPPDNDNNDTLTGGLRGRITVKAARYEDSSSSSPNTASPLLKIHQPPYFITLASPKPRAGVPYLRNPDGRNVENRLHGEQRKNPIPRERTFLRGQTLIRKVYPTHQQLIKEQEVIPESSPNIAMASKVISWIEPGTKFRSRIHFTNLSNRELAVLLWLLQPTSLAKGKGEAAEGYHHIGFGKPLGMGTVRVKATLCHVLIGSQLAAQYKTLTGISEFFNPDVQTNGDKERRAIDIRDYIDRHLPDDFDRSLPVTCFKKQAYGWNDDIPVSYPTDGQKSSQSNSISDNPTLLWFRKREDNRVNLASLYSESNPNEKEVEKAEKSFGPYSFPDLLDY